MSKRKDPVVECVAAALAEKNKGQWEYHARRALERPQGWDADLCERARRIADKIARALRKAGHLKSGEGK